MKEEKLTEEKEYYLEDVETQTKIKRITSYLIDFFTILLSIIILNTLDMLIFNSFRINSISNTIGIILIIILLNPQSFLLFLLNGKSPGTSFDNIEFINKNGEPLKRKDYFIKMLLGTIMWIIPLLPLLNILSIITSSKGQSFIDEKIKHYVREKEPKEHKQINFNILTVGIFLLMILKIIEITKQTFLIIKYDFDVLNMYSINNFLVLITAILVALEGFLMQKSSKREKYALFIGLFAIITSGIFDKQLFTNIICIIISIIGLILSIKLLKQKKETGKYGIALNSFALVLSIIVIIIVCIYKAFILPIEGSWNCNSIRTSEEENYSMYMHLYSDKTFYIYDRLLEENYSGTYTYKIASTNKNKYELNLNISPEEIKKLNLNKETINYEMELKNKKVTIKEISTDKKYTCEKIDY